MVLLLSFHFLTFRFILILLLCSLVGVIYGSALYFRSRKTLEISTFLNLTLFFIRFFIVTLTAFIVFGPSIVHVIKFTEKPILLFAQDNSYSIGHSKDSAFYNNLFKINLTNLKAKLSNKYDVQSFTFGAAIKKSDSLNFSETETNMSAFFDFYKSNFIGRNVGAIILISDGLVNSGFNPIYAAKDIREPIYAIALGDTLVNKDISIVNIEHNQSAYIGDNFPVKISIKATFAEKEPLHLTVSTKNKVVVEETIQIPNANYSTIIPLNLKAETVGSQLYTVKIAPLKSEVNLSNNQANFFIDIRDSKETIAIVYHAPHPDIECIKSALETNSNYAIKLIDANSITTIDKHEKISLYILHQLSKSDNALSLLAASSSPILFIGDAPGSATLGIKNASNYSQNIAVEPCLNELFSLFTISPELKDFINHSPAIISPIGSYQVPASSSVLMYRKIGNVETSDPLFLFNSINNKRVGYFLGDGLWRWSFANVKLSGTRKLFNELINKTVYYLSVSSDNKRFYIYNKHVFNENENIEMTAEVLNSSYELISEPDIKLSIINAENKKFNFLFDKSTSGYHLKAGSLPPGIYSYEATVKIGSENFNQKGNFIVQKLLLENSTTTADHHLLYTISQQHNGKVIYPSTMNSLENLLDKRDDIVTISHEENEQSDLINFKLFFLLIVILLGLEWTIRKRNGV